MVVFKTKTFSSVENFISQTVSGELRNRLLCGPINGRSWVQSPTFLQPFVVGILKKAELASLSLCRNDGSPSPPSASYHEHLLADATELEVSGLLQAH